MAPRAQPNLNAGGTPSRIDSFSGEHTVSLIVGILIVVIFIGFVIIFCVKDKVDGTIITPFFTLLGTLSGFFVGNAKKSSSKP